MTDLYTILGMISRKEYRDASVELTRLLQTDPQNAQAWGMLALTLTDSQKKIDCYQRVLKLEPGNSNAVSQLKALGVEVEVEEISTGHNSSRSEGPVAKPVTGSLVVNKDEVRLLLVADELHSLFDGDLTLRVDYVHHDSETKAPFAVDLRLLAGDREVKEYKNIPAGGQFEYRAGRRYEITIAKTPSANNLLAIRVRRTR